MNESRQLEDQITILEEIGRGGMGVVYRAHHRGIGRDVAVKVLQIDSKNSRQLQRLRNEARIASKLKQANIVSVLKFGIHADSAYLVMELLSGRTLAQYNKQGPEIPLEDHLRIFAECADAMHYAHQAGVVHRDIKPQNIILVEGDDGLLHAKLADFGIAKSKAHDSKMTMTGAIVGTALYMSPEQCAGMPTDNRSDIYSFGCVMYECLARRPVFAMDNPFELAADHMQNLPAVPSVIPGSLTEKLASKTYIDYITLRCLQKHPDDRYQSAGELSENLQRVAAGQAIVMQPLGPAGAENPHILKRQPAKRRVPGAAKWFVPLAAALALCITLPLLNADIRQFVALILNPSSEATDRYLAQLADCEEKLGLYKLASDNWSDAATTLRKQVQDEKRAPAGDWTPTLTHYASKYTQCLWRLGLATPCSFWKETVLSNEASRVSTRSENQTYSAECKDISQAIIEHGLLDSAKHNHQERLDTLMVAHKILNMAASKLFLNREQIKESMDMRRDSYRLLENCPQDLKSDPQVRLAIATQAVDYINEGETALYNREFVTAHHCFITARQELAVAYNLRNEPVYLNVDCKTILKQAIVVQLLQSDSQELLRAARIAAKHIDPSIRETFLSISSSNLFQNIETQQYISDCLSGQGNDRLARQYQLVRKQLVSEVSPAKSCERLQQAWDKSIADCQNQPTFLNNLLLLECTDDYMRELRKQKMTARMKTVMDTYRPLQNKFAADMHL